MSFLSCVVFLILKKTSLLLSVTLMLRCSLGGWSSGLPLPAPAGDGVPLSELDMVGEGGGDVQGWTDGRGEARLPGGREVEALVVGLVESRCSLSAR